MPLKNVTKTEFDRFLSKIWWTTKLRYGDVNYRIIDHKWEWTQRVLVVYGEEIDRLSREKRWDKFSCVVMMKHVRVSRDWDTTVYLVLEDSEWKSMQYINFYNFDRDLDPNQND